MINLSYKDVIDFDQYLADLRSLGYIYIDESIFLDELPGMEASMQTYGYLLANLVMSKSGRSIFSFGTEDLAKYLVRYEKVPESMIYSRNKKGQYKASLAKNKTSAMADYGYAKEFVHLYQNYNTLKHNYGSVKKLPYKAIPCDTVDANGKQLSKMRFHITLSDNLRTYYSDQNVQSIPKNMCDCIVAPKGYVLVSGDFEQADLRIAYSFLLRDETTMQIFMKYPDKYEAMARILMGDKFDLDYFKEHRKYFKIDTLKPIYGGTSGTTRYSQTYVKSACEYLKHCKRYQENLTRITDKLDNDLPLTTYSYFGNKQIIPVIDGGSVRKNNIIRNSAIHKALNAPIQTGTSEIVTATERSIMNEFAKYNITPENGGIFYYLNRHDELIFLLKEEYLPYSWIFQKHQVVQVDDWVPLAITFSYTRTYTHESPDLDELAKSYYKQDIEDENNCYTPKPCTRDFYPVKRTFGLAIGLYRFTYSDISYCAIAYYDYINHRLSCDVLDNDCSKDDIYDIVHYNIQSASQQVLAGNYDSIVAYSNLVLTPVSSCVDIIIKEIPYTEDVMELQDKADILAEFTAYVFLKNHGVQSTKITDDVRRAKPFIESVLKGGSSIELATAK